MLEELRPVRAAPARGDAPAESRLWRRAAQRLCSGHEGIRLLHRRRRPVRCRRAAAAAGTGGPDTGLVNGYKLERHDPAHRIWIGRRYNFCARLLFRIRIRDIDCDYRLIRRALLEKIQLTSTSGTICVELVRKLEMSGCEVVEVGVAPLPAAARKIAVLPGALAGDNVLQLLRLWVRVVFCDARHIEAPTGCGRRQALHGKSKGASGDGAIEAFRQQSVVRSMFGTTSKQRSCAGQAFWVGEMRTILAFSTE